MAEAWAKDSLFLRGITVLPPAEEWVLNFALAREEHLTDEQCLWFQLLTRLHQLAPEAEAAFQLQRDKAPPPEGTGHHVGALGTRGTFKVRVHEVKPLGVHEKYGPRFLVPMTSECGAELVWFTGENLTLKDNTYYTITARVEDHGVFNGVKQTRISRVKEVECPSSAS